MGRPSNKTNDNYFSNLTTENCQWGGYIAADGCIHKTNSIRLQCKYSDKVILDSIKKDIQIANEIKVCYSKLSNGKTYPGVLIYFSSNQIVSDLKHHFNITKRKSFTLLPPNIEDEQLKLSYIVGMINGDGSIFRDRDRNLLRFNITGTIEICEWFRSIYNYYFPLKEKYIYKNGRIFSFSVHNKTTKYFLKMLLNINCFHLIRKWGVVNSPDVTVSGKER